MEILAATKYVPAEDMPALAEAGIVLVGENRAQDLLAKQAEHRDLFTWDFIGALQSRKVRDVAPERAPDPLDRLGVGAAEAGARPGAEVLIQVNVAEEEVEGGHRTRRSSAPSSSAAPCRSPA